MRRSTASGWGAGAHRTWRRSALAAASLGPPACAPLQPGPQVLGTNLTRRRLCRLKAGARWHLRLERPVSHTKASSLREEPARRLRTAGSRTCCLSRAAPLSPDADCTCQGIISLSLSPARHTVAAGARLCRCWRRRPATGLAGAPQRWTKALGRCPGWSTLSCGPPPQPSRRARPL